MRAGVRYNKTMREILGLYKVRNMDLASNFDPATEGMIEVSPNHPIFGEQEWWFVNTDEELERKLSLPPPPPPTKHVMMRKLVKLILDEFNILRALHGLPPRTMQQVLNQIEE